MSRPTELPVVHIIWIDSEANTGWTKRKKLAKTLERSHSAGFLMDDTPEIVTLAVSFDPETDSVNNYKYIPKGAILEMRILCLIPLTEK